MPAALCLIVREAEFLNHSLTYFAADDKVQSGHAPSPTLPWRSSHVAAEEWKVEEMVSVEEEEKGVVVDDDEDWLTVTLRRRRWRQILRRQ